MRDRDTEAEGTYPPRISHPIVEGVEDDPCTSVVAGVELIEGFGVVGAALPFERAEVSVVRDPEVVERTQQVLLEGFPETDLDGCAAAEELPHVDTVGAVGRRGQTEEFVRLELPEQRAVRGRLCVMKLVDHSHVVRRKIYLAERLNGSKYVLPPARALTTNEQLTERSVAQHLAVGALCLLEQFPTMRDEQQALLAAAEPAIVESGHDCLARTGRGDDEVAVPVVHGALGLEGFEDALLVRARPDLEPREDQAG